MLLLSILFACGGAGGTSNGAVCVDNGQCGEGQACVEEVCTDVACTSSASCDLGEFCSDKNWTCEAGCLSDSDCSAGSTCNTEKRECEEYGCRSTQLDCEIGELCDVEQTEEYGECYEDTRAHCQVCDAGNNSSCPNNASCFVFELGDNCRRDSDCPDGWTCDMMADFQNYCHRDRCLVECNPNNANACPRGYQCGDTSGFGDYHCIADCAYLDEGGYL